MGHQHSLSVKSCKRPSVSPQDLAQVNEENLPVYNRCSLYALCAAYLNLISQLTTVPAFCQHIHEVGVLMALRCPCDCENSGSLNLGFPQNFSLIA